MPKRSAEYMAAQREQVLEAALQCFADHGFHATSTEDIARAAGCGKSAIYAHFTSKRAIVEALAEREVQRYERQGIQDISAVADYVVNAFAEFESPRSRRLLRFSLRLVAESLDDPVLARFQQQAVEKYIHWTLALVRGEPAAAGLTPGQVRDVARRFLFFWAGQGIYKMMIPTLPNALVRQDMKVVLRAIIESARAEHGRASAAWPKVSRQGPAARRPRGQRPAAARARGGKR